MKLISRILFVCLLSITFSLSSYGQNKTSTKTPQTPVVEVVYELPKKVDYKVFGPTGELVVEGKGKSIKMTGFAEGTYFIEYDGKNVKYLLKKK